MWQLHAILAEANLLACNNKSQICYCGQISLQSALMLCMFQVHSYVSWTALSNDIDISWTELCISEQFRCFLKFSI